MDRATPWGNPFVLGKDGDRATVIARYRDHSLPFQRDLLARLGELRGKALGCWCAPAACHADVLIQYMERRGSLPERAVRSWAAVLPDLELTAAELDRIDHSCVSTRTDRSSS